VETVEGYEGALFKKVDTTALFCRPNKRSPDEPSETEVNADISSFQWRPINFFVFLILPHGLPHWWGEITFLLFLIFLRMLIGDYIFLNKNRETPLSKIL
jgi:hypothetical protein